MSVQTKKWVKIILFSAISIMLIKAKCGVAPNDSGVTVEDLRLTNAVSGWIDQASMYKAFDVQGYYNLTNGKAVDFDQAGMQKGIVQQLQKTGKVSDVTVIDMSTDVKAADIYNFFKLKNTSSFVISTYPDSVAFAIYSGGGITVFAHFNKFYFELAFSGYTDPEVAKGDAALFLSTYETLINK
jgi:hypothetical protein